jgi:hypothetical protein
LLAATAGQTATTGADLARAGLLVYEREKKKTDLQVQINLTFAVKQQ